MEDKLIFDIEALQLAVTELENEMQRMKELKQILHEAVENLRTIGWQSQAGKKFFEKFDNTWETNLSNYILVLEHMSQNTMFAKGEYQRVVEEFDNINLQSQEDINYLSRYFI